MVDALDNAVAIWSNASEVDAMAAEWDASDVKKRHEALVAAWIGDVDTVADLGCGVGRYSRVVRCKQYYGFDSSMPMLDIAKRLNEHESARYALVDIFAYTSSRHYDVVIMIDVAQHQSDPVGAVLSMMKQWSANRYIVSLVVGDEREYLYATTVVPFSDLTYVTRECELLRAYFEQYGDERFSWMVMELAK